MIYWQWRLFEFSVLLAQCYRFECSADTRSFHVYELVIALSFSNGRRKFGEDISTSNHTRGNGVYKYATEKRSVSAACVVRGG